MQNTIFPILTTNVRKYQKGFKDWDKLPTQKDNNKTLPKRSVSASIYFILQSQQML